MSDQHIYMARVMSGRHVGRIGKVVWNIRCGRTFAAICFNDDDELFWLDVNILEKLVP